MALGTVIPLGDGSVGKTVLSQLLINKDISEENRIGLLNGAIKSTNIEMEFVAEEFDFDGTPFKSTMQFYIFPGQIQKESARTVTFDEILRIFEFLPAMKTAHVLLLVYDTNRIYTLKSLENWLIVALEKQWIQENTLIILVSNKVDLHQPNKEFVNQVKKGIVQFANNHGSPITNDNVISHNTSCLNNNGIDELRNIIARWIAENGIKRK